MQRPSDDGYLARHREWEDLIVARGNIAWWNGCTTPFMSAWCIFQRYCRLNGTNGAELREPANVHDLMGHQHGSSLRNFLYPECWVPAPRGIDRDHDGSAFAEFLTRMRGAGLTHFVGGWVGAIAESESVRQCAVCSAVGYHSIFAQVSGFTRCPIHDMPYATTCRMCGAPLPCYRLERELHPCMCRSCKTPFLSLDNAGCLTVPDTFRQSEARAWGSFSEWLCRVRDNALSATSVQFPCRTEESEPSQVQSRYLWVLNEVEPLPDGLKPFLDSPPKAMRVTRIRAPACEQHEGVEQLAGSAADERRRVFASIRRHIVRRYLASHRRCLRSVRGHFLVNTMIDGRKEPVMWQDDCYTTEALLFWERSLRQSRGRGSNPPDAEMYICWGVDRDIRVWAHQVLAAFYERFVAVRLWWRLDDRRRSEGKSAYWRSEETYDIDARLDAQDARLFFASVTFRLRSGVCVLVGRGPLEGLGRHSASTCDVIAGGSMSAPSTV